MKTKVKKSVLTYGLASLMMALLLFASCTSNTEDKKLEEANKEQENIDAAQKDLEAAKEEYKKKYDAFKMEAESKIAENEKILTELEARPKNKNKTVQAEIDKTLAELEEKNKALKDEINNYQEMDDNKWEDFKIEFNRDMTNLGDALKDLTKKNVK